MIQREIDETLNKEGQEAFDTYKKEYQLEYARIQRLHLQNQEMRSQISTEFSLLADSFKTVRDRRNSFVNQLR